MILKVFFINNGTTHYYNLVLNKLNNVPGLELSLIVPAKVSSNIGEGVYQTREGIAFKVHDLEEYTRFHAYSSFKGLARALWREKPDVVIVNESYLLTFLFNIPVILTMKLLRIKLILKTIPFRLPTYEAARTQNNLNARGFSGLPRSLNHIMLKLGITRLIRNGFLQLRRLSFNIPDAHVNYVDEAYEIWGSYGIRKEKIFITRNSPDTDLLLGIRESLKNVDPVLPVSERRLIHVGRLVEWKRVDLLLMAFAKVKLKFADAELLIIGNGPEEPSLKALSRTLGIAKNVRFLGGIHDPKLLGQYLMSSTIYILAGMGGLSINDAMCFGLPVICSVGDGTEKKLVRDEFNGKYFQEGNKDDLAGKITYLFDRPELRKLMGENSIGIIRKEINIHSVIEEYVKAINYAIGT